MLAPLAACMSTGFDEGPVGVALYVGGDDGATQRLAEALTNQLNSSGRYRLALAEERTATRLTITNHVQWYPVRGVDFIGYDVAFGRPDGRELGRSVGRCQAQRMEVCALRIVHDLDRALRSR